MLDLQLLIGRQLLSLLGLLPGLLSGWWLATHLVRLLDGVYRPSFTLEPLWASLIYTAVLFLMWDFSRYLLHRLMHELPVLWALHQVHHSAEHLTPLTFFRLHPLESMLYQLRGALVTGVVAGGFFWMFRGDAAELTLFGVHAIGFLFNVLTGNLRHSHLWIRFGAAERWLISPAQHQLHHARHEGRTNYGTWLAIWDRAFGSLELADTPPEHFGIADDERNHGHDLLSAWFGPLRDVRWVPAMALALVLPAQAQDDADEEETVFVYQPDGTPRVSSAAHVIGEAELEQFEYDDIGRILSHVPGVYVRGEDGYGLRPNIGMRGTSSDRSAKITLLEDGLPIAPAPYAAPAAYYFPMSTRLTGVEVFKGAAATQHGPQTVGGAVNVRTRQVPRGTAGAVDIAYGMRETAKLHAWVGSGGPRGGVLLEAAYLGTNGFKVLDGGGGSDLQRTDLMMKLRHSTDPALARRHSVELKLGWSNEDSQETYLGLHPDDYAVDPYRRYAASALSRLDQSRAQAELTWQADPSRTLRVRTTAYYRDMERAWNKFNRFGGGPALQDLLQKPAGGQSAVFLEILRGQEDSATEDQTLWIGTNDRRYRSFGVQSRLRWRVKNERVDNQLEAGIRLHGDSVSRVHTEEPFWMTGGALTRRDASDLTTANSLATATALALHIHDDLQIGPVHLLPGVRTETVRTQLIDRLEARPDSARTASVLRNNVLPSLALLLELGPSMHVFTGAHRGFSPVAPGQPAEIRPELSWSYELGMRLGDSNSRLEIVGYANDYSNLTGQCTISGGCVGAQLDQQFNGGKAWVYGVESAVVHEVLLPGRLEIPLSGSYTLTQSRFRTGFVSGFPQFGTVEVGDRLPYLPEHQAAARVSLTHPRFSVGVGASARSAMRDVANQGPFDGTGVPAQLLIDLAADAQVNDDLRAYATVINATNSKVLEAWRPFGARPTAPLQVMVGLKLRGATPR